MADYCKHCKQRVRWVITEHGPTRLDHQPADDGTMALVMPRYPNGATRATQIPEQHRNRWQGSLYHRHDDTCQYRHATTSTRHREGRGAMPHA